MKTSLTLILLFITLKCSAGVTDWISFNLENGHVKIPATVTGIDTYAILDTGAQLNAINAAFVNEHNLQFARGGKIKIKGVFGIETKTTYNNVAVSLFDVETTLNKIPEIDVGHHTTGLLLGAGFFNTFVVQLDYPNEKMRLITRDSLDVASFENIEIRRQVGTGMPIVKIGLPDNKHLWLILDTGNNGGMVVNRKVANKLGWLAKIERKSTMGRGANTTAKTETFRIPQLQFGPFTLENVLVTIPAEGENANLDSQSRRVGSRIKGRNIQGLIGYDILKHFLLTIDYEGGHAHIGLPDE